MVETLDVVHLEAAEGDSGYGVGMIHWVHKRDCKLIHLCLDLQTPDWVAQAVFSQWDMTLSRRDN